MIHSDIILGDLASNIWRNNAYKISYIGMTLNSHWMVTEMYLPFIRLNGDWKMTEWRLSVFTEWWRFVLWYILGPPFITGLQVGFYILIVLYCQVWVCSWFSSKWHLHYLFHVINIPSNSLPYCLQYKSSIITLYY